MAKLTPKFPKSNAARDRKTGRDVDKQPIIPKLTQAAALEFVKLVNCGISPVEAVGYLLPTVMDAAKLTAEEKAALCVTVAERWYADRLMLNAINQINGGQWQDLDPDRRLSIARDKHYAELAYYLYTHNYAHLEGVDLKKANDARAAIDDRLANSNAPDSPFERAIADIAKKMNVAPQDLGGAMPKIAETKQ